MRITAQRLWDMAKHYWRVFLEYIHVIPRRAPISESIKSLQKEHDEVLFDVQRNAHAQCLTAERVIETAHKQNEDLVGSLRVLSKIIQKAGKPS